MPQYLEDRPMGKQTVSLVNVSLNSQDSMGVMTHLDASPIVLKGCFVQPVTSQEFDIKAQDRINSEFEVWIPPYSGVTIGPMDAIIFNGQRYEVFGDPNKWFLWDGRLHHWVVRIRRQTG